MELKDTISFFFGKMKNIFAAKKNTNKNKPNKSDSIFTFFISSKDIKIFIFKIVRKFFFHLT